MEETLSIGEVEDDEIIPRIPDFHDTLNYCTKHLFQALNKTERLIKINEWLSANKNRRKILAKAVEVCLRARDEANEASSDNMRRLKESDEKAMQEHLEYLIENNYETYAE